MAHLSHSSQAHATGVVDADGQWDILRHLLVKCINETCISTSKVDLTSVPRKHHLRERSKRTYFFGPNGYTCSEDQLIIEELGEEDQGTYLHRLSAPAVKMYAAWSRRPTVGWVSRRCAAVSGNEQFMAGPRWAQALPASNKPAVQLQGMAEFAAAGYSPETINGVEHKLKMTQQDAHSSLLLKDLPLTVEYSCDHSYRIGRESVVDRYLITLSLPDPHEVTARSLQHDGTHPRVLQ
ncbi:hypothetical protein JCM11491_000456 [Sporobolomyces phaffii]